MDSPCKGTVCHDVIIKMPLLHTAEVLDALIYWDSVRTSCWQSCNMIMTVLPLKRTPFIFFFFFFGGGGGGGGTMNHDITTHMEDIIDSHNWIMDIHNCTMGNRTYVCSIVDKNMWSPLWLSIIWLLIHNLKYEHPYELFKYGYP